MKIKKILVSMLIATSMLSNTAAFAEEITTLKKSDVEVIKQSDNKPIVVNDTAVVSEVLSVESLDKEIKSIEDEIVRLQRQNDELNEELKGIKSEIEVLSKKIVSRRKSLEKQARSLQKQPTQLNTLTAIVDSKSISEALSKTINAQKLTEASTKQLKRDEKNKKELEEKQKRTQTALDVILKNQEIIKDKESNLHVKQAQLGVAKLETLSSTEKNEVKKAEIEKQLQTAKKEVETAKAEQAKEEEKIKAEKERLAKLTNKPVEAIVLGTTATATGQQVETVQTLDAVQGSAQVAPVYDGSNTYPIGQCTWGAKALAPWAYNYWGNGGDWVYSAAAAGFRTGSTPMPGAIACWTDGGYGHVAVVTDVQSPTMIQVMEANYNGNMYIANFRGWFNPIGIQGQVSYIYPPGS